MMKFWKSLKRSAMAALIGSTLLCGGGTAYADQAGLDAFKEAMTASQKFDDRVFREQIIFFLPDLKANLDFQGVAHSYDDLRLQGNFNIVATDEKGNTTPSDVPFYIDQNKKDVTLYFKTEKQWQKLKASPVAALAVELLSSPSPQDLKEIVKLISNAEILKETPTQRTLLLDMDEAAIAAFVDGIFEGDKDAPPQTPEEAVMNELFRKYFEQGVKNTNVWCIWTVDKQDWQTITFSIDLSGVLQEASRAALNDPELNLDPVIENLLESFAYYSEFKAYTTYLNPDTKSKIDLPKEVMKAKEVESILPASVNF